MYSRLLFHYGFFHICKEVSAFNDSVVYVSTFDINALSLLLSFSFLYVLYMVVKCFHFVAGILSNQTRWSSNVLIQNHVGSISFLVLQRLNAIINNCKINAALKYSYSRFKYFVRISNGFGAYAVAVVCFSVAVLYNYNRYDDC